MKTIITDIINEIVLIILPIVLIMPIAGGSSAIQRNNVAALMQLPRA